MGFVSWILSATVLDRFLEPGRFFREAPDWPESFLAKSAGSDFRPGRLIFQSCNFIFERLDFFGLLLNKRKKLFNQWRFVFLRIFWKF
jgi:hypothetical protein